MPTHAIRRRGKLTDLVEELVALVQNKHLQVRHGDVVALGQREDTAGSAHHDVGSVQTLEHLDLTVHGLATVDDLSANVLHELGEADDLILDLVSEFASVAQDHCAASLGVVRDRLQN